MTAVLSGNFVQFLHLLIFPLLTNSRTALRRFFENFLSSVVIVSRYMSEVPKKVMRSQPRKAYRFREPCWLTGRDGADVMT